MSTSIDHCTNPTSCWVHHHPEQTCDQRLYSLDKQPDLTCNLPANHDGWHLDPTTLYRWLTAEEQQQPIENGGAG